MKNNKNDIFQSLTDKLEEKEFEFNPSHWEAAEKMIPSKTGFWSPKWAAGIGSAVLVTGILSYGLLTDNEVEQVIVENTIETPVETKEELVEVQPKEEIIVEEVIIETKLEKQPQKETPVVTEKIEEEKVVKAKVESVLQKELVEVAAEEPMSEEEFVEFIATNDLKTNSPVKKDSEREEEYKPLLIPNIFTPNADGQNDYFKIDNLEGNDWTLIVFNTSGNIVFETQHYNNQWYGEDVENGTYIYKFYNAATKNQHSGIVEIKR